MPMVDKESLQRKYAEERAKRLRADGNDQYLAIEGTFDQYLEDPYTSVVPRESKTDHVTVAIRSRRAGRRSSSTAGGSGDSSGSTTTRSSTRG